MQITLFVFQKEFKVRSGVPLKMNLAFHLIKLTGVKLRELNADKK